MIQSTLRRVGDLSRFVFKLSLGIVLASGPLAWLVYRAYTQSSYVSAFVFLFLLIALVSAAIAVIGARVFRDAALIWLLIGQNISSLLLRQLGRLPLFGPSLVRLSYIYFACTFYAGILIDRAVRRSLSIASGHHRQTGKLYSLVNAPDPRFDGFRLNSLSTSDYSLPAAFSLSLAAKLAYEHREIIEFQTREWGFDRCSQVRHGSTRGFVASTNEVTILSFAGTRPLDLRNLLTDINIALRSVHPQAGHVHAGFSRALGFEPVEADAAIVAEEVRARHWSPSSAAAASPLDAALTRDNFGQAGAVWSPSPPAPATAQRSGWFSSVLAGWRQLAQAFVRQALHYMRLDETQATLQPAPSADLDEEAAAAAAAGRTAPLTLYEQTIKALHDHGALSEDGRLVRPLFICGHSLGGALATLFSALFALDSQWANASSSTERLATAVYTYGAPRVGDLLFAHAMQDLGLASRLHRFVLNSDLVTRLPVTLPQWLVGPHEHFGSHGGSNLLYVAAGVSEKGTPYTHVGKLHLMDASWRLQEGAAAAKRGPELFRRLTQLVGLSWLQHRQEESALRLFYRLILPYFINDHFPCDYVRAIRGNLEEEEQQQKRK